MTLNKVQIVDRIEVLENGCVQVRTKTSIMENDKQIGGSYHRYVITPGSDYSSEEVRVQAICAATHTANVIEAYQAATAAQGV